MADKVDFQSQNTVVADFLVLFHCVQREGQVLVVNTTRNKDSLISEDLRQAINETYFGQRLPAHLLPLRSESPEVRGLGWSRQRQT